MFSLNQLKDILFVDIETVPVVETYDELPERMQALWDKKSAFMRRQDPEKSSADFFGEKAGIYAEFAKVACISCGYLQFDESTTPSISMKSFYGEDERQVLEDFGKMLDKYTAAKPSRNLCAHNGKEFDYPFLGRRYLIQGLKIPYVLQVQGKKPWEVSLLDSMELWKFGDYKSYTSLDLLSAVLGIQTPKDDIDGSMVAGVYYQEKDHERIKVYCEKDVKTTAQVLLRMSRQKLIPE